MSRRTISGKCGRLVGCNGSCRHANHPTQMHPAGAARCTRAPLVVVGVTPAIAAMMAWHFITSWLEPPIPDALVAVVGKAEAGGRPRSCLTIFLPDKFTLAIGAMVMQIWNAACGPDLAITVAGVHYNTRPSTGARQAGQFAFVDGEPVGFALATEFSSGDPRVSSPEKGWVDALAVAPAHQGRGIGLRCLMGRGLSITDASADGEARGRLRRCLPPASNATRRRLRHREIARGWDAHDGAGTDVALRGSGSIRPDPSMQCRRRRWWRFSSASSAGVDSRGASSAQAAFRFHGA
jgi:GNAT superfamily N-acetyltransferase